jgi:hypothetical protein
MREILIMAIPFRCWDLTETSRAVVRGFHFFLSVVPAQAGKTLNAQYVYA